MATLGTQYETLYVLKSNLGDSDTAAIHSKIDSVITKFNGKLINRDDWGNRELAYQIEKEKMGRFTIIQYTGTPGVVSEVERHFRISSEVIRFLSVVSPKEYDYEKIKKQIHMAEEEIKRNKEARKKAQ